VSEHTYPTLYPPGCHWALDEAWAILDLVAPGVIPPDVRALLAGAIAGTLVGLTDDPHPRPRRRREKPTSADADKEEAA
jgi:hypothetical protein